MDTFMSEIDSKSFQSIVKFLKKLPEASDPKKRALSWRTADKLFEKIPTLRRQFSDGRALDSALRSRFLRRKLKDDIRPAYYPEMKTGLRIWGHVDNVGQGPSNLDFFLRSRRLPLEPLDIDNSNSRTVFLSHALHDHHFAARVRVALGRNGVRSWMAEGDLSEGCNLFAEVRLALDRCHALLALVSSLSISSAWVHTEIETAVKKGKVISAVVDVSDEPITKLIERWKSHPDDPDGWLNHKEGTQALANVLERFRPRASASRLLKFPQGIRFMLDSLKRNTTHIALFPAPPSDFNKDSEWMCQFDSLIKAIKSVPSSTASIEAKS